MVDSVIIDGVIIDPLLYAFRKFETFRMNDKTEQERAGTVKAFEYCLESSRGIMKQLLKARGIDVNSNAPREIFRVLASEGLIEDPKIWFDFVERRNRTAHKYNQIDSDEVIEICEVFSNEVKKFLGNLGITSW